MTSVIGSSAELPGEEQSRQAGSDAAYARLLARLSHQSVVKRFEAYVDVPWEDPAYALDPEDPRFELPEFEPLGSTSWYRALPAPTRARLGAHLFVSFMKIGAQFENALQRGLLEYALELPNGAPEFRYVYHELIEEAHHSLMFQEFVNRSGLDAPGIPAHMRIGARRIVRLARRFPELFFFFVLGGEDPIDYVQRTALRDQQMRHPLLRTDLADPRDRGGAPSVVRAGLSPAQRAAPAARASVCTCASQCRCCSRAWRV